MTPNDVWMAVRRGWWLVAGALLAAAGAMLVVPPSAPQVVRAHLSLALDVPSHLVVPTSDAGAAKVGETLVDDISRIIGGDVFAAAVAERLQESGSIAAAAPAAGEIASSLSATDRHRIVDITVTRSLPANANPAEVAGLEEELVTVALAAAEELTVSGGEWFALLGADGATLALVDSPEAGPLAPGLRQKLEAPLRLLAAVAVGVSLAVVLWLADPRVRSAADARAAAELPVLGAVSARRDA